jgi:hypothetical protein
MELQPRNVELLRTARNYSDMQRRGASNSNKPAASLEMGSILQEGSNCICILWRKVDNIAAASHELGIGVYGIQKQPGLSSEALDW